MQIGPQKYPFKKQNGTTLNPATEETSTSILGYIVTHVPVISDIYNWLIDKWDTYIMAWRTSYVDTDNNYFKPAAEVIISDRGIALPKFDYIGQSIVSDTVTYTYKLGGSGGTTVATVTAVYTDATLQTLVSITKT